MLYAFYFFAAVLVWLSFRSFVGGIRYRQYVREEMDKPRGPGARFATVLAPCKGLDEGLSENLRAVLDQDHSNYEVIFIVDDAADPAVPVIKVLVGDGARLVIADRAQACSQKIANLLAGIRNSNPRSEVFVFVDSDARPSRSWLSSLVAALDRNEVGVATGYRWFLSEENSLAAELLSVWNASIASSLGPRSNFCWGGSAAVTRQTFEDLNVAEQWRSAVSDDFVLASVVLKAGLDIVFVPDALTASFQSSTFGRIIEFTNRQMKLTRVYSARLWLMTLFGCGIFTFVMMAAVLLALCYPKNHPAFGAALVTLGLVSIFSSGKAWLRLEAVKLAMPHYSRLLKRQFWAQMTLWAVTPALFFVNAMAALFFRRISWRGITYELCSPTETVIIAPK